MQGAIIDYGMGNVASVEKALTFLGIPSKITRDQSDIASADFIILPGVGAFNQGMQNLRESGLIEVLNLEVMDKKKPFMGICLGMQLIADRGYEPSSCKGLGWIQGEVIKIKEPGKSIPHLGWNEISAREKSIMSKFDNKDFYFIHSYHFDVKDPSRIMATVNYGKDYVAVVQKDNIFATQFHPEKSQTIGLALIKNFFEFYA
jgi:glutamine amidotransferase